MANVAYISDYKFDVTFDLIEKMKLEYLKLNDLKDSQLATVERNYKISERRKLTDEEIERFEKNEIKRVIGEGENSIVYRIGSHIYANINKYFLQLL